MLGLYGAGDWFDIRLMSEVNQLEDRIHLINVCFVTLACLISVFD